MRLKCIKLAGFKSFVDPTVVNFPSNMSAVVGPNGCGKSNIIDAVRWVMGESSAKNLRGESMADVIFNGSNTRKPIGQAAIELVFDNSNGSIGGEYAAFSEISIRRKVTRDGDNHYYLNGAKCRRKDITDIFLGTGLGPRSYAIIEQGMISKLIEAKPDELRVFVEEAAGISRYKERRRDTENRIRRTRENLERLTDIREELERQLQHLQRQAKNAERYKELKAEERELKARLLAVQCRQLAVEAGTCQQEVRELEVRLEAVISERVAHETEIEKQRQNYTSLSDRFNQVQGEFYALGADIARDEQRIQGIRERDRQLHDDLAQVVVSADQAAIHMAQDEERLAAWQGELTHLLPEWELARTAEEQSAAALLQAEEQMQEWQGQWDDFNHGAAAPRQQAEVQQSRIQHLEQVLKRLGERIDRLLAERAVLQPGDDEQEVRLLEEQLAEAELGAEALRDAGERGGERIRAVRQQSVELRSRLDVARQEQQQRLGRQSSLEALQQEATDPGEKAAAWLQQQGLASNPRLADTVRVDSGWETAVETVLGDYLQASCVDDLGRWLPEMPALAGTGLTLVETSPAGGSRPAGDLLPLSTRARGDGVEELLAGVFCADDITAALAQRHRLSDHQSLVTPQGLWIGRRWVRVPGGEDGSAGIIRRQRELEQLRADIHGNRQLLEDLEQQLQGVQDQLQREEAARDQQQRELAAAGTGVTALAAELSARRARMEQTESRRRQLDQEVAECRAQQVQEQGAVNQARAMLQEALDHMEQDSRRREELLRQRDEIRRQLDSSRQGARRDKDTAHHLAVRHQGLVTQIESVTRGKERLGEQARQLEERRAALAGQIRDNTLPLAEFQASLEERLQQRLAVEERLLEARQAMQAAEHEMREADNRRNQADKRVDEVRSELEGRRLAFQSLETRRRSMVEQLQQEGHELEALLAGLEQDVPLAEWQSQLEQVTGRIARLGPINLAAIDEYQSQAERKHYLDAQNEDLVEAMATLETAIRKIDRETRARFKETFDEINAGLGDLFPRVFGGGEAYLELTGDDLLDTGITIMARPPGKKNSTIHLLSGGEKALTAIALVFAIFRLKPAPFCMLDEVDAPLDDANVGRYARMVREMSEHVQFIYITHNKISMEMADQLMGVTMHEPGVSRLVTVDIDEAAELAAS